MTIRNILRKLTFRPTYLLIVYVTLKSGKTISIRCDSVTVTPGSDGGLTSYSFKGTHSGDAFYINVAEIAAIQNKNY